MDKKNLQFSLWNSRRLIEHVSYAKEVSYYELLTEGIIGLAKAAENFDGRGPFIKYAQPFVKAELYKGMAHFYSTISCFYFHLKFFYWMSDNL